MMDRKYTFDDWLKNKLVTARPKSTGPDGKVTWLDPVFNDSRRFFLLGMDYSEWDKIQRAQATAYDIMVNSHLAFLKNLFQEKVNDFKGNQQRFEDLKNLTLKDISIFIDNHPDQYKAIVHKIKHRGIPYGAVFVTPQQYLNPPEYPHLEFPNSTTSGIDPSRMFEGEIEYLLMDANLRFRDSLNEFETQQKQDEPKQLNKVQTALYHIYQGIDLVGAKGRLLNNYTKLNKPGKQGPLNRQCAGGHGRTLTTRLLDFQLIRPLITSANGIKMIEDDIRAIEKAIEDA